MSKLAATRFLIAGLILFICMAVVQYFYPEIFRFKSLENSFLLASAQILAVAAMVINGSLIETRHFKIILICLGVTLVGRVMRIMHLPRAKEILLISDLAILISYLLHFYSKPEKRILDILKLLTVVLLVCPTFLREFDPVLSYDVMLIGYLALVITFITFLWTQRRSYLGANPVV